MDSFAAREACREGRYNDVIAMYDKAAPDGSWTNWDYYYYAYALRKVKNYAKGREIARAGIIAFPEFTNLTASTAGAFITYTSRNSTNGSIPLKTFAVPSTPF